MASNSFLKSELNALLQKRKEEILSSKLVKTISYFKDLYEAKSITSKNELSKLKNSYYNKYGQTWQILKYSRIGNINQIPLPIDPLTIVREETFKLNLKTLQETCNVISLDTLLNFLDNNEQPPIGSVVITIDGGYASSFEKGLSCLLDYELPATFSLPTAYIGTAVPLWDVLIKYTIKKIKELKLKFPILESFSSDENKLISDTFVDELPGPSTDETLIYFMLSLEPSKRMLFMENLTSIMHSLSITLPNWIDFMSWDDVQDIKKAKYNIVSMLHSAIPANLLKIAWLEKEIENSIKVLDDYEIKSSKCLALPSDQYSKNTGGVLSRYGIKYSLSGENAPLYYEQDSVHKILRRRTSLDGVGNQANFFLMNLFA
jgi:hypothetical protein